MFTEEGNAYGLVILGQLFLLSPFTHEWSELGFLVGRVELEGTWEIIKLPPAFYILEMEVCKREMAY